MPVEGALVTMIEMSLRYRGQRCAWSQVEQAQAITLVGVDDGRAFAVALDRGIGLTNDQAVLLTQWRRAGALVGYASTIREVLAILDRGSGHAG